MAVMKNQRIKSLSTRFLWLYKNGVLLVLIALFSLIIYYQLDKILNKGLWGNTIFTLGYFLFIIYGWMRINRNVYHVEFDNEYLYVMLKEQDILIPLENIKEVDIKSLGGVYEVELFQPEQLGKKFYFKPSLLYPFNFKRKDALVNVLRKNINLAQQKKHTYQANALHS
jgi:hypothetical protein